MPLTDDEKYEGLYPLWGDKDLYEEDEDEALKLAKEKYPDASDEEIIDAFYEFLADNE